MCRELPFCPVAGIRGALRIADAAGAYRVQVALPDDEHPVRARAAAVVSAFYEALLAEDALRALGVLAPEVAWYEMPGGPYARPDGRPYQGAAEIAEGVLSRRIGDVEDLAMVQHEMLVYGDSIVVLGHGHGDRAKDRRQTKCSVRSCMGDARPSNRGVSAVHRSCQVPGRGRPAIRVTTAGPEKR